MDEEKNFLSSKNVTAMSYDLVTSEDDNINSGIKGYLVDFGWKYIVPEQKVIKYYCGKKGGSK